MKKADDIWNNECRGFINASSKLDFYASRKVSFGIPPPPPPQYLTQCIDPKLRNAITKMRISAHKLPVETERYSKAKTPREERLCPFCCKSTGDETHYLIECKNEIFAKVRLPVITHFLSKYPIFSGLDQKQKLPNFCEGVKSPLSKEGKFCLLIHETFSDYFSVTSNK